MKTIKRFLYYAMLLLVMVTGGSYLTSCNKPTDDMSTLEEIMKDGSVVVLTFILDGEPYDITFVRVGDTYFLLDAAAQTRGDTGAGSSNTELDPNDFDLTMEQDKANNILTFIVKEKGSTDIVFTAVIDIKECTINVIPGNSKIQVEGYKMKVDSVEITNLLKDISEEVTLADALVKGAKVEVFYKWNGNKNPTVFTFINEGGKFSCEVTGEEAGDFNGSSLTIEGNALFFSAENWLSPELCLKIYFYTATNSYKFWTVMHDYYNSHTISVNGTDITSKLKEER